MIQAYPEDSIHILVVVLLIQLKIYPKYKLDQHYLWSNFYEISDKNKSVKEFQYMKKIANEKASNKVKNRFIHCLMIYKA